MDNNLSRKLKPLGTGASKQFADNVALHEFKPYHPRPLPGDMQERMDAYRSIRSYSETPSGWTK